MLAVEIVVVDSTSVVAATVAVSVKHEQAELIWDFTAYFEKQAGWTAVCLFSTTSRPTIAVDAEDGWPHCDGQTHWVDPLTVVVTVVVGAPAAVTVTIVVRAVGAPEKLPMYVVVVVVEVPVYIVLVSRSTNVFVFCGAKEK
jgi:hypothetical protein